MNTQFLRGIWSKPTNIKSELRNYKKSYMTQKEMLDNTMKMVKTAIIRQGWTQVKLAKEMGLTVPALAYKITDPGKFKAIELKLLCDILRVRYPHRLPRNLVKLKDIV